MPRYEGFDRLTRDAEAEAKRLKAEARDHQTDMLLHDRAGKAGMSERLTENVDHLKYGAFARMEGGLVAQTLPLSSVYPSIGLSHSGVAAFAGSPFLGTLVLAATTGGGMLVAEGAGSSLGQTRAKIRYDGIIQSFYERILDPIREELAHISEMLSSAGGMELGEMQARLQQHETLLKELYYHSSDEYAAQGKIAPPGKLLEHIGSYLQIRPRNISVLRSLFRSKKDLAITASVAGVMGIISTGEALVANNMLTFVPGVGQASLGLLSGIMLGKNIAVGIPAYMDGIKRGRREAEQAMEEVIRVTIEATLKEISDLRQQASLAIAGRRPTTTAA